MKGKRLIVATLFVLLTVFMTALPAYSRIYRLTGNSRPGDVINPGRENCKHDFGVELKSRLPKEGTMYKSKDWCVKFGYKKCKKCKREVVTNVYPQRHKLYVKKRTNPTCVNRGVVEYYCRLCQSNRNKPVQKKYTKPLGHKYGKTVIKNPTCEKDGYKKKSCTRKGCNHVHKEIIESEGHRPKLVREERFRNGKLYVTKYYVCTKCLKYLRANGRNGYVAVSSKQEAIP